MSKALNLTGQVFGRWTVLQKAEDTTNGRTKWLCRCSCGTERAVGVDNLRSGQSLSCGCLKRERSSKARFIDITGQQFGRLTVLALVHKASNTPTTWRCLCECGTETVTTGWYLRSGHTKSCGCFQYETRKENCKGGPPSNVTHGKTRTSLHNCWIQIKQRTTNPNHPNWEDYGGRGITMDPRYQGEGGFERFEADVLAYMGERPSKEHSINRIDNDAGYFMYHPVTGVPQLNWATQDEQLENRRPRSCYRKRPRDLVAA